MAEVQNNTEETAPQEQELDTEALGEQRSQQDAENLSSDENTEVIIEDDKGKRDFRERPTRKQLTKAIHEAREQRNRQKAEKEELQRQNNELLERLSSLEKSVNKVVQTKRPDPFDYSSSDEFYQALDAWQKGQMGQSDLREPTSQSPQQPKMPPAATPMLEMTFEEEVNLAECEAELSSKLPDYENAKADVDIELGNRFGITNFSHAIAKDCHMYGLDPAKVIYALHRVKGAKEQFIASLNNPAATRQTLANLESKIKFRPKKTVTGTPEAQIQQSGSLDSDVQALEKAKEEYYSSPTLENHNKLRIAKQKIRDKGK